MCFYVEIPVRLPGEAFYSFVKEKDVFECSDLFFNLPFPFWLRNYELHKVCIHFAPETAWSWIFNCCIQISCLSSCFPWRCTYLPISYRDACVTRMKLKHLNNSYSVFLSTQLIELHVQRTYFMPENHNSSKTGECFSLRKTTQESTSIALAAHYTTERWCWTGASGPLLVLDCRWVQNTSVPWVLWSLDLSCPGSLGILRNEQASTETGLGIFFFWISYSESKDCSPCKAVGIHWFSILQ